MNKHESLHLSQLKLEDTLLKEVSRDIVEKYAVIPISKRGKILTLACSDPENIELKDIIEQELNQRVDLIQADQTEIQKMILLYYGGGASIGDILGKLKFTKEKEEQPVRSVKTLSTLSIIHPDETSVVDIFDYIMNQAILNQASDIHIEPAHERTLVRIRIDGVLHKFLDIPRQFHKNLISSIKVEAKMDITESRLPQDGELELEWNGRYYNLRVATVPTIYGEQLVARLLSRETLGLGLESLGFSPQNLERLRYLIKKTTGMTLVTGPTGSGKTTTLFSILSEIRHISKNIMTIEDPVEYRLPLLNQMEVNHKVGLSFATAGRSFLRQDPDVILMGEIRDLETANIAIQNALAGTALLSTLHSNDAISTIARLVSIGIERFWVASTLTGVIAQRLVRKICPHCKESYTPDSFYLKTLELEEKSYPRGKGCEVCRHSGYIGRTCLSEILTVTEQIKTAIYENVSPMKLKEIAFKEGFVSFKEDAKQKVVNGLTTPEEILRVLSV